MLQSLCKEERVKDYNPYDDQYKEDRAIDHFKKDWVREFTHGIVGSFGGQMLVEHEHGNTWRIKEILAK